MKRHRIGGMNLAGNRISTKAEDKQDVRERLEHWMGALGLQEGETANGWRIKLGFGAKNGGGWIRAFNQYKRAKVSVDLRDKTERDELLRHEAFHLHEAPLTDFMEDLITTRYRGRERKFLLKRMKKLEDEVVTALSRMPLFDDMESNAPSR